MARPDNDQTGIRTISLVGGKSFAVSLPLDVVAQLQWKKGDKVVVRRHANTIIIEKKEQ